MNYSQMIDARTALHLASGAFGLHVAGIALALAVLTFLLGAWLMWSGRDEWYGPREPLGIIFMVLGFILLVGSAAGVINSRYELKNAAVIAKAEVSQYQRIDIGTPTP